VKELEGEKKTAKKSSGKGIRKCGKVFKRSSEEFRKFFGESGKCGK
jgi:hypothetical protein